MSQLVLVGRMLKEVNSYLGARSYIVAFLIFISAVSDSLGIMAVAPIISSAFDKSSIVGSDSEVEHSFDFIYTMQNEMSNLPVSYVIILIGFLFACKAIFNYFALWFCARLQKQLMDSMKIRIGEALGITNYRRVLECGTGAVVDVIAHQASVAQRGFNNFINLLAAFLAFMVYALSAFVVNWKLFFVAILIGVCVIVLLKVFASRTKALADKTTSLSAINTQSMVNLMHNLKYLVATGGYFSDWANVREKILAQHEINRRVNSIVALLESIREPIIIGCFLILLGINQQLEFSDNANFLVIMLLFYRIFNSLMRIQKLWVNTVAALPAFERVCDLVESLTGGRDTKLLQSKNVDRQNRLLGVEFRGVSFDFEGTAVCKNLNIDLAVGDLVVLSGPTGAGKSTIMDLALGLLEPIEGSIRVTREGACDVLVGQVRDQCGFVPQFFTIKSGSIIETLLPTNTSGPQDDSEDYLRQLLKEVDLLECLEALPNGLQTNITEYGINLSGGQLQRLALVRELLKKPTFLFLDEPTSALDSKTEAKVVRLLQRLSRDMMIMVISHSQSLIRSSSRHMYMEGGIIVTR